MQPRGHDVEESGGSSESASDAETTARNGGEEEWCVEDAGSVLRALGALDALRKAREHYDVLLTCDDGTDTAAHRALLAAASPHLLRALPAVAAGSAPTVCRVPHVQADALAAMVQWCYSGRLCARTAAQTRALYMAAWTLRMEAARLLVADRLIRRLTPSAALAAHALPDLPARHKAALQPYITEHFDEICSSGSLSSLPLLRVDLVSSSSTTGGLEAPAAVAGAILAWLKERHADTPLEQLCARAHLVYVDSSGAIQDCDQLPTKQANSPVIAEYRAAAASRREDTSSDDDERAPGELLLGGRAPKPEWEVVAAKGAAGVTRAALILHGKLVGCRLAWRDVGGEVVVGGPLGGAAEAAAGGERRAPLVGGRAAAGGVTMNGRLIIAGGYDRAQVLKEVVSYDPLTNQWSTLPAMKVPRARFPAAILHHTLYVIGGSDGHNELDSVHAYRQSEETGAGAGTGTGTWRAVCPLPSPLCLAGGAAAGGGVWLAGGLAGGKPLKACHRYSPEQDQWTPGPPLNTARSQVSLVQWCSALWALGGCDAWHCLASTETVQLHQSGLAVGSWAPGPALPTARRSVGAAAWKGSLYCAGGSDGVASLTRCDRMRPAPAPAPAPAPQWEAAPCLRRGRAAAALVAIEDVLYAVGGFDGKEFLSCVECLYDDDGEWTSLCSPPPPPPPPSPAPTLSPTPTPTQPQNDKAPAPGRSLPKDAPAPGRSLPKDAPAPGRSLPKDASAAVSSGDTDEADSLKDSKGANQEPAKSSESTPALNGDGPH